MGDDDLQAALHRLHDDISEVRKMAADTAKTVAEQVAIATIRRGMADNAAARLEEIALRAELQAKENAKSINEALMFAKFGRYVTLALISAAAIAWQGYEWVIDLPMFRAKP